MSTSALAIIVEPDSRIRDVLRVELTNASYTVLTAEGAEDAEDMAARMEVQMIVLDVSQVKLRGYSACARIRRHPGYRTRPIILTATEVETRDTAAAGAAGATALLAKPYSVSELFRAVRPYLSAHDPLRDNLSRLADKPMDWDDAANWSLSAGTGLRRDGRVMSVTSERTVRIPLVRVT
jgi:DNA-binding response OmpR family regulator